MDSNFETEVFQVCRTCMMEITSTTPFFYLDYTPPKTHLTIRRKLNNCIPELDLSIVSNSVICSKCTDTIKSFYEFKKQCLQSEIQIKKYIQQLQHTGDVNLVEVVQSDQPHNRHDDAKIKIEDIDIKEDFKNEDLMCDTDVFNEASESDYTESMEPEYLLSLRKVDTQFVLFNTNENYSLSVAKENVDTTSKSDIALSCLPKVTEYQDSSNKTNSYYQCYRCGHEAESKLKLILHIKRHTQKRFSHKKIASKRPLRNYKNRFGYYKCSLCNYLTNNKYLLGVHNRIHLTKKDYKYIFKHQDVQIKSFDKTIRFNKLNMEDKRNCVNQYYNKHNFKNQRKYTESKQHCNSSKPSMGINTVQNKFKCAICKFQSNWKQNFIRHLQVHAGEKPFSCSVCKYKCTQKASLKYHMQIHTGNKQKPFTCSVCKLQYIRKGDLKRHMEIHHTEGKSFSCSICGFQSGYKGSFKRHMEMHTGEKPFSCSVCKFQCRQKSDLKNHIRTHTGEKPFSCSVCEFQFRHKSNLKNHILIHTGEKPFSCSICEFQCRQRSDLKSHVRIHTGEKPFSCSVCEFQCGRKSNLQIHMQIHTGVKPFSCSVCEYKGSRKSDLQRHIRIHKLT